MDREGIYVEIPIHANMDELWEKTQNPELHQRWDLRFSQIEYLPRQADELQKFLYRTRVGFGLKIDGQGESVGERDGDGGARTSSLKFWSEDPKSLIKTGSGYWKYVPDSGAEPAGKGPLTALGQPARTWIVVGPTTEATTFVSSPGTTTRFASASSAN
jgi:hypothetical protein